MASIIWTETANNNLIEIKEYISLDSPLQAVLLIEAIFTKVNILARYPESGKKLKELPNGPYREVLFKKYRIIYRLEKDNVYILLVHHASRLLKNNPFFKNYF